MSSEITLSYLALALNRLCHAPRCVRVESGARWAELTLPTRQVNVDLGPVQWWKRLDPKDVSDMLSALIRAGAITVETHT